MTPTFLRTGTERDVERLVLVAGTRCVLNQLKATFPHYCNQMVTDLVDKSHRRNLRRTQKFCECVQADLNEVSVDTFRSFVASTVRDFSEYKDSQMLPEEDSHSLLGSMQRCGLKDVAGKARD